MGTPTASVRRHRVAVVGAGYFSQFHLDAWAAMADVELVGLCDTDRHRAAARAAPYGIGRVFTRVEDLLDATRPDLVDIVTPPASHTQVVSAAIERSLPAICQKPFAASYAEALALTSLARDRGTALVIHENFRFMPWFREARRLIDAGRLGTLHGISFRLRPGDGQGPGAYLDRQPYFRTMPRLLVLETAIHFIDTFRFLMGEVHAVYARLRRLNPAVQGEDAALITFEFSSGAAGLFDGNRLNDHVAANPRRTMGEMWLEGSAGVLRLDGEAQLWWKPHHGPETEHIYETGAVQGFGGGAAAALQRHVLDGLAAQHTPENTASEYLQNLRVQQAVYASHHRGQRIEISQFDPLQPTPAFTFPVPSKENP